MSSYTPYSLRHNLEQWTDIAKLLDYCERDLWLDIYDDDSDLTDEEYIIITCWTKFSSMKIVIDDDDVDIDYDYPLSDFSSYFEPFERMDKALFFRTYRTLLPEIRDLYSK